MDFDELKAEFSRRGFDYIDESVAGRWINQAYQEICTYRDWPFLWTSTSGAAPLAVADLGSVESVLITSSGAYLHHEYRDALLERGRDLAEAGTATRYYIQANLTVKVWPGPTTNITVNYFKTVDNLTAALPDPEFSSRFHDLIIEGAVRRAYLDSDNAEMAQAVEAERQQGLDLMVRVYFNKVDRDPDIDEMKATA